MSNRYMKEVSKLRRGDVVRATVDLPEEVAPVKRGALGVVFQPANYHEEDSGPMVRWTDTGYACNVYDCWADE